MVYFKTEIMSRFYRNDEGPKLEKVDPKLTSPTNRCLRESDISRAMKGQCQIEGRTPSFSENNPLNVPCIELESIPTEHHQMQGDQEQVLQDIVNLAMDSVEQDKEQLNEKEDE